YLGKQFDIHAGGEEHIPIHHENEIAQSEAGFGKKPWVRYWLHSAWLLFKDRKMSKSKGEILTLSKLEEQVPALVYRYFCFTAHYRKQLTFSQQAIKQAKDSYKRLKKLVQELDDSKEINKTYLKRFENAINDDLNMPLALSILWEMLRSNVKGKKATIREMDKVLGLDLLEKEKLYIPKEIKELADKRDKLRQDKQWEEADKIRTILLERGWEIRDEKKGYVLEKI
ncbi:MAG: DALR domain-containing protein, partial [Candidatus Nanoarchaeia archaeon]